MKKIDVIRKMVEESSSFSHMRVKGLETITCDKENYVESVTKFIHKRLEGISIYNDIGMTGPQVINAYRQMGQWIISKSFHNSWKDKGHSFSSKDLLEFRLVRKVN